MEICYLSLFFFFISLGSQKTEQPLLLYSLLHFGKGRNVCFRGQSQVGGPLCWAQGQF